MFGNVTALVGLHVTKHRSSPLHRTSPPSFLPIEGGGREGGREEGRGGGREGGWDGGREGKSAKESETVSNTAW